MKSLALAVPLALTFAVSTAFSAEKKAKPEKEAPAAKADG